jgi:hypothetical protein
MRIRDAAAWIVAPALLVAVAAVQWWRVSQHDQSTWSGVGFGMFATFENDTNRFVSVTVEVDGEGRPAAIPDDLAGAADDLLIVPSEAATERLAAALADRRWSVGAGGALVGDPDGTPAAAATVVVGGVEVDGGDDPSVRLIEVRRAEAGGP